MAIAHNNRRRFLAFIGLLGAPAAVWSPAQAQDAATSQEAAQIVPITCTADDDTPARLIEYSRGYQISDGKLVFTDPPAGYLNQAALKSTYGNGASYVKRPDDPAGFNVRAPNFRIDTPSDADNLTASFSALIHLDTSPSDINGRLTLADGTTEDAYVRFYNDSLNQNLTQIDTTWTTKSPLLLTKPLTVELIGDGKSLGKFTFDMSKVVWRPFVAAQEQRITSATFVTFDAVTGDTTVEGCTGSPAGSGAGCFFTTATVETLGMSDDCWELRTLRRFRDGPLAQTPQGRALTARYYAEAPRLVAGIARRTDASRVWLKAYWTHILPCAVLARLGLHRLAVAHYAALFAHLQRLA